VVYWLSLALAVGATAIIVLVLRSRLGLALRAVRDSEEGARGLGVDVTRTRVAVWVLAAFWTGCTGAVILLNTSSTTAGSGFSVLRWTALVIFIVVIGGIGSTTGPIIGIVVFWLVDDQLADAENWRFIVLRRIRNVYTTMPPSVCSAISWIGAPITGASVSIISQQCIAVAPGRNRNIHFMPASSVSILSAEARGAENSVLVPMANGPPPISSKIETRCLNVCSSVKVGFIAGRSELAGQGTIGLTLYSR
jgi:hypothetical protein